MRSCRIPRARGLAMGCIALALGSCSVNNLSYPQVVQDIDCAVEVEGVGDEERLVYRTQVEATWGIARWSLMNPFRWFLFPIFGDRVTRELENPSAYVRELAGVLAPKAGDDLGRCASAIQRLVRIAELDPAPINRIVALAGLSEIAAAREVRIVEGLAELGPIPALAPQAIQWRDDFARLRPSVRVPVGAPLSQSDAQVYLGALAGLCSQPLPAWRQRLALLEDLDNAVFDERQGSLRGPTRDALSRALAHAIRGCIVEAALGRNRELTEVRICALELMHRSGGAESVPLLLALIAASPQQIQEGEPQFEENDALLLRLVHMCGQLDESRAMRSVRIAGRADWQEVAPAEFLARLALDGDPFLSTTALPAREALAVCIGRGSASPDPGDDVAKDWVAIWWSEYRKERPLQ